MSSVKVNLVFGKQNHQVELTSSSFETLQTTLASLTGVPPSQQKIIAKGGGVVRENNIAQIIIEQQQLQSNGSTPKWMLLRTGSSLGENTSNVPPITLPVRIPIFAAVNDSQSAICGEPEAEDELTASAPSASSSPLLGTPFSASEVKILCCEPSDEWWDPVHHPDLSWWQPTIDVVENAQQVIVYAELPGLSKDKFVVNLHEEYLFISGTKYMKNFQRRVLLPPSLKHQQSSQHHRGIRSEYSDGLLTIYFTKR